MGVLPLQFDNGASAASLGLTGREEFTILGIGPDIRPGQQVDVLARSENGEETTFAATVRIDAEAELDYYLNGGILQMVLRQLIG
jgi:aconitate hydratase